MSMVRKEIFGLVLCILSYEDENEALRRPNATPFGLAGNVVSRDMAAAHRFVHRLQTGICWMLVGGYHQSGIGRESGLHTLLAYAQVKSVQVELDRLASVF